MENSKESALSAEQAFYEEMFEEHTIIQRSPNHCPHYQGWCVEHDSLMHDESFCRQVYDDIEPTEAELGYVGIWAAPVYPDPEPQTEE